MHVKSPILPNSHLRLQTDVSRVFDQWETIVMTYRSYVHSPTFVLKSFDLVETCEARGGMYFRMEKKSSMSYKNSDCFKLILIINSNLVYPLLIIV